MTILDLLRGKATIIKAVARQCGVNTTPISQSEIHLYLSDIQDHVATMMSDLDHFEQILSRSHLTHLARHSMDGIAVRNRTVAIIGRLAIIGGVVVVLTVVCGLFGMNVPVPGQSTDGLFVWFGILGLIAVLASASFIVIRIIYR